MTNYAKHETDEVAEIVRDTFSYDPESGVLIRVKVSHPRYRRFLNKPAGSTKLSYDGVSHVNVSVRNRTHSAHRLCWLIFYGEWPNGIIDHEDGDGLNNRKSNLRCVNSVGNSRNRRKGSPRSGHTGVSWRKDRCRWRARITVNRKIIHLGLFKEIEDAVYAREIAKAKYGFSERHGN